MHLHEVTRARVQLRIGGKEVFFLWSSNDFQRLRYIRRNMMRQKSTNGTPDTPDLDSDDASEDEGQPNAFLPDGTWNQLHLRRIVHVLDVFKISFQAYHELRMTSNSILPPLNLIMKCRKRMSDVLTVLHHKTVIDSHNISFWLLKFDKIT